MRGLSIAVTLVAVLACGACGPATPGPVPPAGGGDAGRVAALEATVGAVLRDLAASDRRFAARAKVAATGDDVMGAVLAEDASLGAVDGAIDPFSFEARARLVAKARAALARLPPSLPETSGGPLALPVLEGELLARMVGEESARLEEERRLPRSAGALLRAVIETWTPPASPEQAAEKDRWLSRRLAEIIASIDARPVELDVGRARELDDVLDALEHQIDQPGFGSATAGLVKLREKLEAQGARPPPGAASDWDAVGPSLRAHLGMTASAEVIDAWLSAAEERLRPRAEAAMATAKLSPDALAASVADAIRAAGEPCADAIAGSILRAMTPPPERMVACRLRHMMTSAADDASRATALVAMHDAVVVARWSLDVARGTATLAESSGRHRTLSRQPPDVAARWERIALARPAIAIGGGLAVVVIEGAGADDVERAKKWARLGDVPLDLAMRELDRPLPPR